MSNAPTLLWFRRDLRLADHPALTAAIEAGEPVIPVFILDPETEAWGAAPRWRLMRALEVFNAKLEAIGSRLILRHGAALQTLQALVEETGAKQVYWSRAYDPQSIPRDTEIKTQLGEAGVKAESHKGFLLFEPWTAETKTGGFFRVYTPFWKSVSQRNVPASLSAPSSLRAPDSWPQSDELKDWSLDHDMHRGADVLEGFAVVGEEAARDRLDRFIFNEVDRYKAKRDFLDVEATSGLSENLTYGEISPRTIWHAGFAAMQQGARGAEHFLKELVWREFAWHLIYHTPHIVEDNWREGWNSFPWTHDEGAAERWRRGTTGEPLVDAAMREMYVTGRMHNRTRMLVASFLTKHLMVHWKIGMDWFAECLTDWDPASNSMGWQWTAGSGPDAAPYFRIYNPETQAEKFDASGTYRHRFLAGFGNRAPHEDALAYFDAIPRAWGMAPTDPYPEPMINLKIGRERALAAYSAHVEATKTVAEAV